MAKKKRFRVWIGQVNQTFVDVNAIDEDEAEDVAYRKWRREFAHARVLQTAQITKAAPPESEDTHDER